MEQTRWADAADFNHEHLAYISAYVSPDDERLNLDAQTLFERYLPHILKLFPEFHPSVVSAVLLWRARYAQPVVRVGYRHLVPEIKSPVEGLYVCTMAQIYPSDRQVSNGVEMARRTAAAVRSAGEQAS